MCPIQAESKAEQASWANFSSDRYAAAAEAHKKVLMAREG